MRLKKITKKISFIFTILVCTLILFCFPIKTVKADNSETKLSTLKIKNYENTLSPVFDSDTYEYNLNVYVKDISVDLEYTLVNDSANVTVSGNNYLKEDTGLITLTVSLPGYDNSVYKINYKKIDIITNGLIANYDGYDIGTNNTVWKNLASNKFNGSISGATRNALQTGMVFDGNDQITFTGGISGITNGVSTLEMTFNPTTTSNQLLYMGGPNERIAFGIYSSKFLVTRGISVNTYTVPSNYANGDIKHISTYYDGSTHQLYYNGSLLSKLSSTDGFTAHADNNSYIGARAGYDYYKGTIYNMRLYNRVLTTKEMNQNYEVDRRKYSSNEKVLSKDKYLKSLLFDNGTLDKEFDSLIDEYTLTLNEYSSNVTLSGLVSSSTTTIVGTGKYYLDPGETKIIDITVTAESGDMKIYHVNIVRPSINESNHSSKLKYLVIDNYSEFSDMFNSNIYSYNLPIYSNETELNISYTAYDNDATVTIENNTILDYQTPIIVTVSAPGVSDTVYTINYTSGKSKEYSFDYTGEVQTFIVPKTGTYILETWGAEGGSGQSLGGYGGYSTGKLFLEKNEKLYIYVGGKGGNTAGGYNGGGAGAVGKGGKVAGGGGGATHIAYKTGLLSTMEYEKDYIVMVAGGGGGAGQYYTSSTNTDAGGNAGGYVGSAGAMYPGNNGTIGQGGTQGAGGAGAPVGVFGLGGTPSSSSSSSGGGGGGYFGGGGGYCAGGGGGSGYIAYTNLTEKHMTCYNCLTSTTENQMTETTTNVSSIPTSDYAKSGNGYAKITVDSFVSENTYLNEITSTEGTFNKEFNSLEFEYILELDTFTSNTTISAVPQDASSIVTGLGHIKLDEGETKNVNITVTSASGDLRVYKVTVKRLDSAITEHTSLLKKLSIDNYNSFEEIFSPKTFNYDYSIYSNESSLSFTYETYDNDATVIIENNEFLTGDPVTITVKAPEVEDSIYRIYYIKNKNYEYEYNASNSEEVFVVPYTGTYKLEAWGAQGANSSDSLGGYGSYSVGTLSLEENTNLYINVGKAGSGITGGYNGGGNGAVGTGGKAAGGGGGATSIAFASGLLKNLTPNTNSVSNVILVAGGGGGAGQYYKSSSNTDYGGNAGGFKGNTGVINPNNTGDLGGGATQTAGGTGRNAGSFGQGGLGVAATSSAGGGGGGYYGGGGAYTAGGGGGSGYIGHNDLVDKHMTCYNCQTSDDVATKTISVTNVSTDPVEDYAKTGDGFVRISSIKLPSKINILESLTSNTGTFNKEFDPVDMEYELTLEEYSNSFTLIGEVFDPTSTVVGLTHYNINPGETKEVSVGVTSELGETRVYKITVTRPTLDETKHTSLLKNLTSSNYEELEYYFNSYLTEYTLNIYPNEVSLPLDYETYDSEATVTITGNGLMFNEEGVITITVSEPHVTDTIYTINYKKDKTFSGVFNYLGNEEIYEIPESGVYKLETWGAQGGDSIYSYGGYGGYSVGNVKLPKGTKLYINVGGAGTNKFIAGYNGGGDGNIGRSGLASGGGGGATSIALKSGLLKTLSSSKSDILIVSGGGGGAGQYYKSTTASDPGGNGGGYIGNDGAIKLSGVNNIPGKGGTQTSGGYGLYEENPGSFGQGGKGRGDDSSAGGGGAGYYGGGGGWATAGAGGSGYIANELLTEKHMTCVNCASSTDANTKTLTTTNVSQSPISDYGKKGDGAALLSVVSLLDKNNYLNILLTDKGSLSPAFDPTIEEYTLLLGVDDTKLKVQGRPSSDLSVIEGLGEYDIPGGLTEIPITVRAESGDERVYKIKVSRPLSDEDRAKNITITGLVSEVCVSYPGYCELDKEFDSDIHEYYMTVPSGIRELEFTVDKMHDYETVIGDGVSKLKEEENVVTIEITSEDGSNQTTYTYYITRDLTGDNYIDTLKVKGINEEEEIGEEIEIGFHYLIEEYSFKVNNEVVKLDLDIKLDDERASYEVIGNENFEVGENVVDIEVKANNNEIRTYRLNVYRVSNDNPLLSKIEVIDENSNSYQLSPEFSDVGKKYTVTVENEVEEVNIIATPQKETTTVTGAGEKTLNVGRNTYTITSMAENGLTFTYEVVVIRLQNSNNYLSELSVTEGSISPEFNKEENNYELTVDAHIKSLTIEAIPEASTSTVTILNNKNFIIGENEVIIRVKAEDGTTRDYVITVTKLGSDNNYLSSLSVIGNETELLTNFNKETGSYEINVGNEVTSVNVTGEAEDTLSTVEGLRTYNLVSGNNEIKVKVTSETGIERIYAINIIRDKNSDASLSAINLTSGSINLEPGVYEYTIEVENNVSSITVTGVPNVSTTEVSGNGTFELISGEEKTITLTTLAEDEESTLTYTLKITRKKNDNAYLKTLSIAEGNIRGSFNKTTNNYTLKVRNNIESVTVNAEAEEETSSVVINNPETLSVGENEVRITVTSESGNVNIYKVIVTRLTIDASKLNLSTLDVRGCTLSPEFNGDTYEYACEVGYELSDTDITATASQEEYKVSGTGAKELNVGENILTVTVEDEKKTESNEYTIRITRLESNETRLKNITVMNHTLNEVYDKDNSEYTLNTSENYLFINTEKMHASQEVTISGNNGLIVGENVVTIHVVAANKVDSRDYIIRVNKSANTNNYLQDLRVEGQTISPEFTKGRMEYTLNVENDVDSVVVNATPEEATSTVSGTGMHSLVKGSNTIKVTVTAESGDERVYTIEVTKLGSRNANLSSLSVTDQTISPEFNKDTTSYDLVVPYEVESVEINAIPEDANALITGDGVVSLNQGINDKGIIVTSENGETKTYWIHITRSNPVTSKLKNIRVRNYALSPVFESEVTNYTVIVDNEVESLDLDIERLDPQSTYVVEGNNLEVGENEVKVISTSSDGEETTEYKLRVVRQSYSNTYLSSLTVSEGELTPTFDKTVLSYEVEVGYEVEQIDIEGVAENSEATVEGNGIHDLLVGENNYNIRVSLNGITRTYNVKIIRKGSNNANILSITSNLGEVEKEEDTIYSLTVPYNTTEILSNDIIVETEDRNAVVSKQGRLDLSSSQIYNIRVTSEDGETIKDYVVNIILDKSTNNYLSSLTSSVGSLNPNFVKTREDYTIGVLDTVNEIEFTAELEDERAEILNESLVFELPEYENEIEIKVKSEKGSVRTYHITVTKSLTRERTLSDIELTGIEEIETKYEFDETTYLYSLTVPYEITNVGFNITKKHPSQIVEIIENSNVVNSCSLNVGINICEVEVENSYGEKNTYTYSIERLKNTNNYLRSLKLTSPNIELEDFDRERQEYNVTVPQNYENIEIEALAEDTENARVSISGTTYLIEGMDNDVSIKVRAQNGSVREYIIHVLRLPESNNLLKTLTVSSGEIYVLSPKFTPGTTEYTLEVPSPVELVGIQGLALDDNARVEGNGDYNLRIGLNKIELKVISSDLQERIYKINITRLADKNVYLSKLEVNNGSISPEFEKTKGVYRVDLPYTESSLSLNLATEDPNATYEILGNSNLKYGENEVRIKVTSSDGSASKTYVLTVVKQGNINNNLKTLKIDGETVEGFDPNITSYTYEVEYAKDNVLIEATPEDSASTVVGEGYKSLVEGTNTINVDVVSQSGLVKTYQVTVTRKLNTNLMAIVTDRGEVSPEFDKETLNYSIEVENNIKDITVIGVKESSNAEVRGNGKYELNVGDNEINLEVTNGIYSRTYKLIVIRKGSSNTNLKYLTVAESILDKEYSNSENEYTLYISDDITSLSLSYEPEDETTEVEEIGNENFDEENEEVNLKIRSTDGSERIVTIHVIRESESTFSNKLLNLSVNKGTMSPRYTEEVQEYTVTVPSNTKEITISATKRGEQKVEGIGTKAITKQREEFKVSVTSKDGKVRVYTLIVYKQAGTDARLSELEFNEGYLTPGFNKNVYNYVLTAESDTRIVTTKSIKTVDENASYEIYGTLLSENNKQIRIEVTAQDGETKKNYIIDVVQEKSNNANLASLTSNIGILTPTFNKNTQSYTIEVENEVSDIIIDAVPENSKATVSGDGKHNLRTGSNTINILVTAETGTVRTYTIIVNRALSSNVDLKDLYVRGYTMSPTFDKDEISYTLEVENDVTYVDIDGELADSLSSVIGLGRRDLTVGLNACDVIVTAENGNIKTYTINITRKDKLSSKIENLVVKEGTLSPTFGKEQLEYTISIPNEYRKITPIITLEDPNATYRILGNSNFVVGNNVVTIEVTSSDNKETTTYTLNVIRNISSNNYLSTLKVSEGTLTPEFDKTVGYYEVEVENDIDRITVTGTPEATTTFIAGFGSYDLEVGENMILIRTMSENGIPRSYQIKVTRKANDSNYLSDLSVLEGSLNPVFDKEHGAYEVVVEEGTKEVHIEGELESESATVTGLGTHTIKAGNNTIDVVVTSESGVLRTYTLIVVRPLSRNTNVTTFTPDTGVLSPTFTNDNDDYVLNVGKNINVVNIEVEPESSEAKVGGNKNITISGNSKEATISVLAEDGTLREIKVTINRESSIEDITVNNKNILIVKGEEVELDITTTPIDANPTYTYEIENNIIDIEGKTIKGLVEGTTKVTVKVEENPLLSQDINVTVTSDKIKSNIYEVKDKEDRIVIGAEEGTTIEEFKDNLLNDKRVINIYDKEGNVVADTDIVRTGLTIKLENNSVTYDEAILIVRGDIDGDGIIDVTDESILTDHVLESKLITGNGIYAADIEEDGIIDVTDDSTLTDYILKIINSLN